MKRNALDLRAEIFSAGDGGKFMKISARGQQFDNFPPLIIYEKLLMSISQIHRASHANAEIFSQSETLCGDGGRNNAWRLSYLSICLSRQRCMKWKAETLRQVFAWFDDVSLRLLGRGGEIQPRLRRHFNSPSSKALSPQFLCMSWSWKSRRRKKPPATFKSCYLFA